MLVSDCEPVLPFILAGQFVDTISTLVTSNVWSAVELLDWLLAADEDPGLLLPAFEALVACCVP